jgi:hypothetical protein
MAAQEPASASWEALGETFYRRQELYSMQWGGVDDLSDYVVAAARWGGPLGGCPRVQIRYDTLQLTTCILAMIRDDRKPVLLGRQQIGKPKLSIYSSAGSLLQTIQVS